MSKKQCPIGEIQAVTEVTRRDIFDFLSTYNWNGRLNELDFLERMFNLRQMPSTDGRFKDAYGDIFQHRINNPLDWQNDWIFNDSRFDLLHCPDNTFLDFLCEMVHPAVRPCIEECLLIINYFNRILINDGYEIYSNQTISGRNIYTHRDINKTIDIPDYVKELSIKLDSEYIANQIKRMDEAIETDPENAIGSAREFIETICKTILFEMGTKNVDTLDFNELTKETRQVLNILPKNIDKEHKGADAFKKVLQSASGMLDGMGEIRNLYGTGHGKIAGAKGLKPHHARLTVGIAGTLGRFFYDCYKRGVE
jgi:hypothetical protein